MTSFDPADAVQPRSGVTAIMPYVPGEAQVDGVARVIKLSSNEAPLGPSPKAVEAYRAQASSLERYPDAGATLLRDALAARFGLSARQILCACGSEELLHLAARAYVDTGDEVIVSQYGFIAHLIATLGCGGTPVIVPERNFRVDVDGIIAAVTAKTKMIYLANPGNPTGTLLPLADIERLHAAIPSHVLLVLDAAYAEFADGIGGYGSGIELIRNGAPNVLVTRTFSKMHGLAGLRVGWAYAAPRIADLLNRVRPAFNVNSAAQVAAIAALDDDDHVRASRALNDAGLRQLIGGCRALGLGTTDSVANFILAHFPQGAAARANEYLKTQGILVRPVGGYSLPDSLRISVGTAADNAAVLDALAAFLGG